jgi:hypothetical protein
VHAVAWFVGTLCWKGVGWISDEVIGFFNETQLLTEINTRKLPGGNGRPALNADDLTAICERTV